VLDVQQARTAATRYKEYGLPERPPPAFTDEMALPPDKRKTYLKATLTTEKARATVAEAESRGARRSSAETLASIGHERIIGSSDLRDINYLELAIAVARAICRIRVVSGAGSGVLVGPRLLMTNNHVLRSVDDALNAEAQFDYQETSRATCCPSTRTAWIPSSSSTSKELDFTVVAVNERSPKGQPISLSVDEADSHAGQGGGAIHSASSSTRAVG
jgi:hypothetical protein